ncbi:MAG: RagB/SusD family nutrient uptake outer membrane protein [Oscillibacter sp.]|nr:RagB/SusD family nutrient uptake outer membrane protein [Oscillibacter sp.]
MKKIIVILLLLGGGLFSGCNAWLDVKPYDSMLDEQLYSTEAGVQRALNGIYLGLISNDLYAKNLSCGAVDVLGGLYFIRDKHNFQDLSLYKYSEAGPKATFESIWKSAYRLISGCNEFLESVSEHRDVLKPAEYPIYMGEALAVRTLLHFDLFRLFGSAYSEATKNLPAIPYYNRVTDIAAEIVSAEVLMKRLLADVDSAIVCLRNDPVLTLGVGTGESFWDYRNYRLNYYAAWALKARMLYYMGTAHEAEAGRIARTLLAGKDPLTGEATRFMEVFPGVNDETRRNDRLFCSEMLFGLHNMKRETLYKELFSLDLENNHLLCASVKYLTDLFSDDNDVRQSSWEAVSIERGDVKSFVKFYPTQAYTENPYLYETQVLLRKSELYLIAAATADSDEKSFYLEELRLLRGFQVGNMVGLNPDDLLDLEWKKEFYGEGQYFFFLKRNQVQIVKDHEGNPMRVSKGYAIPLPESETNNRYENVGINSSDSQ